jgi:alpha-ketoglutarate-dependent taurine dioxygenase
MAIEKGLSNIKFIRLWDLLDHPQSTNDDDSSMKAFYLAHTACFRRELSYRFRDPEFDVEKAIKEGKDVCLTYRGYLKFLSKDLEHHPQYHQASKKQKSAFLGGVARQMLVRGRMFALAIKARYGDCVRLSIHDSIGADKVPIHLIPQPAGAIAYTPWHSSIAVGSDGSFRTVHADEVRDTHELVYRNGFPYYYREKAPMFAWDTMDVSFEFLYPTGIIVRPSGDTEAAPSLKDVPMEKVKALSHSFSPVVLRGFADTVDEPNFMDAATRLGDIQYWTFGAIQKVRNEGHTSTMGNNVTSNEAMGMHYDGVFKFKGWRGPGTVPEGEENVQIPPKYQLFTCLATAPRGSGYTLFSSSKRFFQELPRAHSLEQLDNVTWALEQSSFWSARLENQKLVIRHPVTGLPCIRWHQPWDGSKTRFSTSKVWMENAGEDVFHLVDRLTYDRRVCLYFEWDAGDVLVNDNIGMLHTRTEYTSDCARELWRIHFD